MFSSEVQKVINDVQSGCCLKQYKTDYLRQIYAKLGNQSASSFGLQLKLEIDRRGRRSENVKWVCIFIVTILSLLFVVYGTVYSTK